MSRLRDPDQPHLGEHLASKAKRMAPPKDLLGWFIREFRAEVPEVVHQRDVWRDFVVDDHRSVGGGSLLGAPRYADLFRRFIEEDAFTTERAEYEGHEDPVKHYVFPIRAAIASLAGRGKATDPYPFMAHALYRTALMDGDWDEACRTMGITEPVRRVYIEVALKRLWARYDTEPPARSLRETTAA